MEAEMDVTFRHYAPEPLFTDDYKKVREFLMRVNADELVSPRFLWGAWEWAVTHGGRDQHNLDKIGIWERDGVIVAIAAYECPPDEGFLIADASHGHLKNDMVAYAKEHLHTNGRPRLLIPDADETLQRAAVSHGFRPTQAYDRISALDTDNIGPYALPDGYIFVSMAQNWDWQQYNRVMWRGFGHEGRAAHDGETIDGRRQMLSSPVVNPELVVAVKAPDGNYVSHCGAWYLPGDFYCYIEPVATDPDYRMMGLGKSAVLEAVKRCAQMGARLAVVVSDQQFYFNIGFRPIQTVTYWELK